MNLIGTLSLLLALIVVVSATTNGKTHDDKMATKSRPNYDFIEYYDCSNKKNGNYIHPTDCTRFITCSNGHASDMACPDCNLPNTLCFGSPYLFYDAFKNSCEYPKITECITDPGTPTDPPTETTTTEATTTTHEPITTKKTTTTTTTEEPSTTFPNLICDGIAVGHSCNKNECQPCGYCREHHSFYFRCNRTFPSDPKEDITGEWVHESCDDDLWWNPDLKPSQGVKNGFGGACDKWDNLSKDTRDSYEADKSCVVRPEVCEWGQDEEDKCTGHYWYFDPNTMNDREDLECNGKLIWDQSSETCRECIDGCEC